MRRAAVIVAGAVVAALAQMAPASADDAADGTVVVRGLDFPSGLTSLAITGCPGLFDRVAGPVSTYLSKSPEAPAGSRALRYDLAGGDAVGSQHAVASMASTTVAGLSVFAPDGSVGVAYAGYQAPADWSTSLVWVGRAELRATAGGWQSADATGLTYTWTQYDLATRQAVATSDEPLGVPAFLDAHGGDGPGFYTIGFGCDGSPFKIDALRIGGAAGVTTYDLEGFTSTTGIRATRATVAAGEDVTVAGALRDGRGERLPHGLLVLEAQEYGGHGFLPVEGGRVSVDAGDPSVTVRPTARTVYRWRFAGTWSVDGSVSPPFTVEVGTVVTATTQDSGVAGATTPPQPGVRATLWRLTAKGRVALGATRIADDGSFRFELPAEAGEAGEADEAGEPWRYVVTVPAAHGNLGGRSPARLVRPVR